MRSKILVNARFTTQRLTGVQRYAAEVLRRLPIMTLLSPSEPDLVYRSVTDRHHLVVKTAQIGKLRIQGHLWEQLVLPRLVTRGAWLWSPGGSGPLLVTKQVVTVHDLSPLEHPEWYDWKYAQFYRWLLPRLLNRVPFVITVSEFTKACVLDRFKLLPDQVIVTPLGVDKRFTPLPLENIREVLLRYGLETPYFIAVSSISRRKNLKRVIEGWKIANLHGIKLVIVGAKGLAFAGKSEVPLDSSVKYIGYVPDEDLPALYAGALGALYLSLYEGFGLPALEAMACGTPLLASDVTSLPEVVGDAGLLVDPYDIEAIAYGIRRIAEDHTLREKLRRKGLERAKLFTWERTAEVTWVSFQERGLI